MDFDALLAVQAADTRLDQLRHRRAHLPARAELVAATRRTTELRARRDERQRQFQEMADRQAGFEREMQASDQRVTTLDKRLYSGEVTATRDLQAITAEVAQIKGRISHLEDEVLAILDEIEPVEAEITALDTELGQLEAVAVRLSDDITRVEGEIAEEVERAVAERAATAAGIEGGLLATYEKLRDRLGGIGAARLEDNHCTGCHLTLPSTEVARLRRAPADELAFCDQCGRILVR